MINLLPPSAKKELRAARLNVTLRRYLIATIFFGTLAISTFVGGFYLANDEKQAAIKAKEAADKSLAQYDDINKKGSTFFNNLTIGSSIIKSDLSFYSLILDIAKVVPRGVIMNNLSIGSASLDTPISINAKATSYDTGINFKNSLENSDLFESVKLVNINLSESDGEGASAKYRYNVQITATFSKGNTKGGS